MAVRESSEECRDGRMNNKIFRKASLERLSTPEQLDLLFRLTRSKDWLAVVAVFILLGTALAWGLHGSIPTKVTAQGVILRRGGVMNVVAAGSGLVVSVDVKPGDRVQANQVIARVAQPGLMERIRITQGALEDARRERERAVRLRRDSARLEVDALVRTRQNHEREIRELEAQAKIAAEQIPIDEQLLARGLITKQALLNTRQKLITLQGQTESLRAQIKQLDAQQFSAESRPQEVEAEAQARITEQERVLAALQKELTATSNVVSPYAGEVLELKVYKGSAVTEGSPIISLQPDVNSLEALLYLSAAQAKEVKSGLDVQISPGTVRREEFGFLKGTVRYVADYPATQAAIMRNLENEDLTRMLTASGPVTEIRIEMIPAETPSGFRWSSPKGPPTGISSGTLCTAMIVTRTQRPLSLVIPMMKETLGVN
jgi:HlyD family secretion protein